MNTLQSFLLALHLIGAVGTGLIVLVSVVGIGRRAEEWYRRLVIGLAIATTYQLVSGAALSLVSASVSGQTLPLGTYCRNLGAYVAVVALVQAILYSLMRGKELSFPLHFSLASSATGFVVALLIGIALYS